MTKQERQAKLRKMWGKYHPRTIADELGVSRRTLRRDVAELGLPPYEEETADDIVHEVSESLKLRTERTKTRKLADQLKRAREQIEAVFKLKEHRGVFEIKHRSTKADTRAVAVAVISDLHIEEVVDPETVNGLNEYNEEVCKVRMNRLFVHMVKLIKLNQLHTQIDTLLLAILGDLISSNIHDELLETARCQPIDAALEALEYLETGVQYILDNTDVDLIIPCKVGNHSRITKKVHISTESGNSLEWFIYNTLANRFKGNKRVTFIIERSQETYVQVWPNFTVRCMHGHSIKGGGGIGGITAPIFRAIFKMNKTISADLTLLGHFHQYLNLGKAIVNGSGIGWAPFASFIHAGYELPRQAFCLIDERVGVTVACPIILTEDR